LKDGVQNTFGIALKVVWQMVLGISIVGMLLNIGMKQLKLHTEIDEDWGRKDVLGGSLLPPTQQATSMNEVRSV
jgi:hypothetical protein